MAGRRDCGPNSTRKNSLPPSSRRRRWPQPVRAGCGWAGAACGLAFGAAVCGAMYRTAMHEGVREAVRSGSLDQVAIAVSGLVFFIVMGALCGALGARGAVQAYRERS